MAELKYERNQTRNALTRYLHRFRFRALTQLVEAAAKETEGPVRILDIGCGPGTAALALEGLDIDYLGLEIHEPFLERAMAKANRPEIRYLKQDVTDPSFDFTGFDIICALETFEHIGESRVVRVIERIARARPRHLLVTVPIEIGPSVAIKNFGARLFGYDRRSGNLRQTLLAASYQLNRLPPHGLYHLGFNWIWLEQTLRHNFQIEQTRSLPLGWIPKWLAPTVMFRCSPYPIALEREAAALGLREHPHVEVD